MINTIVQWAKRYPDIVRRIDQVSKKGGHTDRTYMITGEFLYGGLIHTCVIFKHANPTEFQFYQSDLCTRQLSPQCIISDPENSYILIEYLRPSPKWNNRAVLSKVFNTLQHIYKHNTPDWVGYPFQAKPKQWPVLIGTQIETLSKLNIDSSHINTLYQGIEIVEKFRDIIAQAPLTTNHGDLSYVNAGMRNDHILLYDWQNLCAAPIEYDISYLFYTIPEFRSDMPSEAEFYKYFQENTRITANQDLCRILYLYRTIYEQFHHYTSELDQRSIYILRKRIPIIANTINRWINERTISHVIQ